LLGYCIRCGCSDLRFEGEVMLPMPGSSSSGPEVLENEAVEPSPWCEEPDGEPEPENTPEPLDVFDTFIRIQ
jgi:hypothetical protein